MYVVLKFGKNDKRIENLYRDEVISRQTIVKRDGLSLGMKEDSIYILIEGADEAIERAREMFRENEMKATNAREIYRKIKESEDNASLGLGAIFG